MPTMASFRASLVVVSSLLAAAPALAGPGKKAPPPPVPQYWIGSFEIAGDELDEGKAQAGTVTVKDAAAPKDAILIAPLDAAHGITPATGEVGKDGVAYKATYVTPRDLVTTPPPVLVVAAGGKPALIKPSRTVARKLLKQAVKDVESKEVASWKVGLADLDGDGIADLAVIYGCSGGIDGVCASNDALPYVRDGKGWTALDVIQ